MAVRVESAARLRARWAEMKAKVMTATRRAAGRASRRRRLVLRIVGLGLSGFAVGRR